jgi:hypothetical protein
LDDSALQKVNGTTAAAADQNNNNVTCWVHCYLQQHFVMCFSQ